MHIPSFLQGISLDVVSAVTKLHPEMIWLTGEVYSSPETNNIADDKSIGQQLFTELSKDQLKEFDRTAVGILVLKWLLESDYESFVACQSEINRLSKTNFDHFCNFTLSVLKNEEAISAMTTFMVINDLTKIKSVVADIERKLNIEEVDHDVLLLHALKKEPAVSPSFNRLSSYYQSLIIEGLSAQFNIGQFMQGENVAASLAGLKNLSADALDFYMLHALCDIGGAGGQFVQNGSLILTEPTYSNFRMAIEALQGITKNKTLGEVYDSYLAKKAALFQHPFQSVEDRALARLLCLFRLEDQDAFTHLKSSFQNLEPKKKNLLTKELTIHGTNDGTAILIYYAPALLNNISKVYGLAETLDLGLEMLFHIYQTCRTHIEKRTENGVFTVMALQLAELAIASPSKLKDVEFSLIGKGGNAEIKVL